MNSLGLFGWLRTVHVGAAFLGLAVYWLPLLVPKGRRLHVVCGRIFVICATVMLATALAVAGLRFIDPIGTYPEGSRPLGDSDADVTRRVRVISASLGAMAVYTIVPLVLAVGVVRTRHHPELLAGAGTRLLLWSQLGVGFALIVFASAQWIKAPEAILFGVAVGVGVAGLGSAWWDLRFVARPHTDPMAWWYKHMELMLRIGIAYHTVFAVFVLSPWLGGLGSASWIGAVVLPTAVGLPALCIWVRYYRRKFAALAPPARPGLSMIGRTGIQAEPAAAELYR